MHRSVPINVMLPVDNAGPGVLPADYNTGPYKTLYLLHGYMGNCTDWLLNSNVAELSQQFNIAIVMPSGENGFYVDFEKAGIMGGQFIGEELVRFTRELFPLSHKREDTIIGGLSMGGFGSLRNSLKYNEVFGHAIVLSAPETIHNAIESTYELNFMGIGRGYYESVFGDIDSILESDKCPAHLAKTLVESGGVIPDMYIACGYNDMLADENRNLVEYLRSVGLPLTYEEGPGTHEWAFWRPFLKRGLIHALGEPTNIMENPFWVEKTDYSFEGKE